MKADIQKLTDILAIDAEGRFSDEDRAAAIELALFRYSSDRPRIAKETAEFKGLHVLTETQDTIPFIDREAVANWAAAFLLDGMAAGYAGSIASTISSDSVEHGAKANNYHTQAAACRKFYRDHMGLDDKRNAAAGTTVVVKRLGTSGRIGMIRREGE